MIKKLLLFAVVMTAGIFAKAQQRTCAPFTFSFTAVSPTCSATADGSVVVSVSGGTAPYTYLWSVNAGSQATNLADSLAAGAYYVSVTDDVGCTDTGYVSLAAEPTSTPHICMVTCDGQSVNNVVYWDKTVYTNVDSFIVYRETASGVYSRIAAISNDSLSEYTDTARSIGPANGDPNTASYRYKLQVRDLCGNYGSLSPYHNTIYIIDAGAGEFSWAIPYTIEDASGEPVNNYVLLCDTANVDIWGPVSTVPPTASAALDPDFANHASIANWRVKTAWMITCTSTRATVNTSRSNIKHASVTAGINTAAQLSDMVLVYPNPAENILTVSLSPAIHSAVMRMVNTLGQQIMTDVIFSASAKQIDISGFAKGIYTVIIECNGTNVYRKLVVN